MLNVNIKLKVIVKFGIVCIQTQDKMFTNWNSALYLEWAEAERKYQDTDRRIDLV